MRIFSEDQNDILINFVPLRQAIRDYLGKVTDPIGLYFEYLPSGNSIGINDQMEVRLASLIKIPVAMGIYKQIELDNLSRDSVLTIKKENINKQFGDLWKRGIGAKITVSEAIDLSLKSSDNTAARTLTSALPEGAIDDVFDSLDIVKDKKDNLPVITPKNYTSILRSLYLSSYLTREHSNEILKLLTKTNFNDALPAGVEMKVPVAHKIGVFDVDTAEKVFSDCGIIYVPNRPYILCIMMEAPENKAKEHLVYISKMVYGYIKKAV